MKYFTADNYLDLLAILRDVFLSCKWFTVASRYQIVMYHQDLTSICILNTQGHHGVPWVDGLPFMGCHGTDALGNAVRVYPETVQGLIFYRSKHN